jgi:hypothetical protein
MRTIAFLVPVLLMLVACGSQESAPASSSSANGMRDAVDAAAAKLPPPDAPLQPGQSVQGVIEADVGKGTQSFRSLATKVADDIGAQMDEKLAGSEGRKAIDEANRALDKSGIAQKVDAADVRAFVGGMAGKTFHDASVRQIDIIHQLQVNLSGKAGDGSQLQLDISFDDSTLKMQEAKVTFRPKTRSMFDFHESKNVQVSIERFERNADGSYALRGSFTAKDVPASNMAKELKGKVLAFASGRFDYAALPLKQMPKIGG